MTMHVIHAVRWGEDGTPSALRCAGCYSDGHNLRQGDVVEVDVRDAVDAILRGDKVQVLVGDTVGPIVRTLVKANGYESIQDIEGIHQGQRLVDLPKF